MTEEIDELLEEYPPTFIVGCSHSGTTLMNAIIGSHSNIYSIREETRLFVSDSMRKINHLYSYYERAWENAKPKWVEKTAEHIRYIDRIFKHCSTAKMIVMIRDGRDVAASMYDRTGNLNNGIEQWVDENTIARSFIDHPGVLFVKYEDLVTDFKKTMMQVFNFIGEEYEKEVRCFYKNYKSEDSVKPIGEKNGGEHIRLRRWQIAQPLFDGRGRYKELERWQYNYVCLRQREMLCELGYMKNGSQYWRRNA